MQISVDLQSFIDDVTHVEKAVKKATITALNWTAFDARDDIKDEMKSVFDNPTPWTLNSIYVDKARPNKVVATIGIKDTAVSGTPAAEYLRANVEGGDRSIKRVERSLRKAQVIRNNQRVVIAGGARRNKYGNITKGRLAQIIKDARNGPKAGAKYFVMRKGSKPFGIFKRQSKTTVTAELGIVNGSMTYDEILNLFAVVRRTRDRKYADAYRRALEMHL